MKYSKTGGKQLDLAFLINLFEKVVFTFMTSLGAIVYVDIMISKHDFDRLG